MKPSTHKSSIYCVQPELEYLAQAGCSQFGSVHDSFPALLCQVGIGSPRLAGLYLRPIWTWMGKWDGERLVGAIRALMQYMPQKTELLHVRQFDTSLRTTVGVSSRSSILLETTSDYRAELRINRHGGMIMVKMYHQRACE